MMSHRQIQYTYDSTKGIQRSSNRDGVVVHLREKDYCIFAVLDGVSSQPEAKHGVNIAAKYITSRAKEYIRSNWIDLVGMLLGANERILSSKYKSPYTTCAIVAVPYDSSRPTSIASVGDTRVYSVTRQYVKQLTKDDSLDASSSVITKYLGKENLQVDCVLDFILQDDVCQLLIATDGFYSLLESNGTAFHKILNYKNLRNVCNALSSKVQDANNDDASYIFVRVKNV